jgi:hypothetical protein
MADRPTRCRPPAQPPRTSGVDARGELDLLVDLLERLAVADTTDDGPTDGPVLVALVGFGRDHVDVATRTVPVDARCGSAGLFGITAPRGTAAVGVVARGLAGRAVPLDGSGLVDVARSPTSVVLAVHRRGGVRARLHDGSSAGSVGTGGDPGAEGAQGVLVDGLHRVLGLPSPGQPPPVVDLLHGWWSRALLDRVAVGRCSVADAVALHPAADGSTGPDIGRLAAVTVGMATAAAWSRLRQAAARAGAGELAPDEAAWMDDTMFARWVVEPLPTIDRAVDTLQRSGCVGTAAFVAEVAASSVGNR